MLPVLTPCRIMNNDSTPGLAQSAYSSTLPSILLEASNKTARNQKREPFKTSDSIKLDASRMRKDDPTLTTLNTLKTRLH